MQSWTVDENYISTLGIKVLQGRNFSSQFATDSTGIIINEAAAKFLATKDLLNKKLYTINDIQTKTLLEYHIIGVMKNFNFSSLRDVVTPLAFFLGKDNGNISVRIGSTDIPNVIAQIKNKWKAIAPSQPFDYSFMDEDFNKWYTTEQTNRTDIYNVCGTGYCYCLPWFVWLDYLCSRATYKGNRHSQSVGCIC